MQAHSPPRQRERRRRAPRLRRSAEAPGGEHDEYGERHEWRIHAITTCAWDEKTVTWATQPAIDGRALATLGAVAAGQVVDFDVTPAIHGDGVYCFAIDTTSTDGVD